MAVFDFKNSPEEKANKHRILLQGDVLSPVDPPSGCRFASRCPYATERCRGEQPGIYQVGSALVSCFRYEGGQDEN